MRTAYLSRIGVDVGDARPEVSLLAELQTAHLMTVPFENLDVFHRRGVRTDLAHSLPKIVTRRRGGWCFELNGAFGWLLTEVGFDVDYVSCRVKRPAGWSAPFDHLGLVARIDRRRWFVDVGFGDSCMLPIPLEHGIHPGVPWPVRCTLTGDGFVIGELRPGGEWEPQLSGSFEPQTLDAFTARSEYLQNEPGLAWSEKPFATRATAPDGSRVTLRPGVLRRRQGAGEFVDEPVEADRSVELLETHFGLSDEFVPSPPSS